tara:strand:- start:319 stop:807 length:489 start_codon:yes stop_codon:yes gene_type:complete
MAIRQDRKTYSFKSVGNLADEVITRRYEPEPKPVGIVTPLQLGNGSNFYKMHYSLENQIKDNLRNLVLTNRGERLGRQDFGADLMPLVFELGTESGDMQAMSRIKRAAGKYLPFVELVGFASEVNHFDNKEVAKIILFLTYTIPRISTTKEHGLAITLYAGG